MIVAGNLNNNILYIYQICKITFVMFIKLEHSSVSFAGLNTDKYKHKDLEKRTGLLLLLFTLFVRSIALKTQSTPHPIFSNNEYPVK